MKYKLGNQGFIRIGQLLWISLFLLVVIPFTQPYNRYYSLLWHANIVIKANVGNPTKMREEIISYANKKNIPLYGKNLTFSRENKKLKVKIYWTDKIDYYGYFQKPLTFIINDEY